MQAGNRKLEWRRTSSSEELVYLSQGRPSGSLVIDLWERRGCVAGDCASVDDFLWEVKTWSRRKNPKMSNAISGIPNRNTSHPAFPILMSIFPTPTLPV